MPENKVTLSRECWHRADRQKRCVRCGETKRLADFYSYGYVTNQGKPSTRYESRCIDCSKARMAEQRKAKPHLVVEQNRRRYDRNPNWSREQSKRYRNTEHGRLKKALLQRQRKARMRSKSGDNAAIKAVYALAMEIERIVAQCPVFDIPELGKKMHVDHIMPLSRGGLHEVENLQILPIGLNMRKGASCPR